MAILTVNYRSVLPPTYHGHRQENDGEPVLHHEVSPPAVIEHVASLYPGPDLDPGHRRVPSVALLRGELETYQQVSHHLVRDVEVEVVVEIEETGNVVVLLIDMSRLRKEDAILLPCPVEERRELTPRKKMTEDLPGERRAKRLELVLLNLRSRWVANRWWYLPSLHILWAIDSIRLTTLRPQKKNPQREASELKEVLLRERIKKMRKTSIDPSKAQANAR